LVRDQSQGHPAGPTQEVSLSKNKRTNQVDFLKFSLIQKVVCQPLFDQKLEPAGFKLTAMSRKVLTLLRKPLHQVTRVQHLPSLGFSQANADWVRRLPGTYRPDIERRKALVSQAIQ
jgi:hypothetical protein